MKHRSNEHPRRLTVMIPTRNGEQATQAERLAWLIHRESMMSVVDRCGASVGQWLALVGNVRAIVNQGYQWQDNELAVIRCA